MGLVEAVRATKGGSVTTRETAESKNVDELLVGILATPERGKEHLLRFPVCIMRVLTAMGICDESGLCKYVPNKVISDFASGGLGDSVKCMFVRSVLNSKALSLTV